MLNETRAQRWRAVCEDGDYRGRWRDVKADAVEDAKKHQEQNPAHTIQIEFEQTGRMSFHLR